MRPRWRDSRPQSVGLVEPITSELVAKPLLEPTVEQRQLTLERSA
jgi:hypothetical protein